MNIHKYKGQTEKEAMTAIKAELGPEALIVSVKHVRPKGVFKLFRKSFVEVTAAIDDRAISDDRVERTLPKISLNAATIQKNNQTMLEQKVDYEDSELDEFKRFIEKFSEKQEKVIEKPVEKSIEVIPDTQEETKIDETKIDDPTDIPMLRVIYEQLLENEIDEKYANELMVGLVEYVYGNETNIDDIVSIIYKRIVKNMSDYDTIEINKMNKNIFFYWPDRCG